MDIAWAFMHAIV